MFRYHYHHFLYWKQKSVHRIVKEANRLSLVSAGRKETKSGNKCILQRWVHGLRA